ncbi:MAG TPA: hypothetical protein VJV78_44580 [Polyangiales bacterium]|nr:hypothetical protein [Polyangiales bacterium]
MADKEAPSPSFSREELMKVFTALGADDPGAWTDSQLEEDIPQLHRFVFLAKAWSAIPDERSHRWIGAEIDAHSKNPSGPYTGSGRALARLRALGASDTDLTELVRAKLAEFLFHVAYLIADPGYIPDARYQEPEVAAILGRVNWALCALNDDGEPIGVVDSLHESVLETDPLHREATPLDD